MVLLVPSVKGNFNGVHLPSYWRSGWHEWCRGLRARDSSNFLRSHDETLIPGGKILSSVVGLLALLHFPVGFTRATIDLCSPALKCGTWTDTVPALMMGFGTLVAWVSSRLGHHRSEVGDVLKVLLFSESLAMWLNVTPVGRLEQEGIVCIEFTNVSSLNCRLSWVSQTAEPSHAGVLTASKVLMGPEAERAKVLPAAGALHFL